MIIKIVIIIINIYQFNNELTIYLENVDLPIFFEPVIATMG